MTTTRTDRVRALASSLPQGEHEGTQSTQEQTRTATSPTPTASPTSPTSPAPTTRTTRTGPPASPTAPAPTSAADPRRRYPNLNGSDFQHPLDKQNTQVLRSLPGLEFVAKSMIMSTSAEEVLFLENISSSVLAGPDQLPTLHMLLTDACETLGMKNVPDLYVRQNPVPNAYTLALTGRRPFIVLHTSLLDLLSDDELQAVIAHELGHLKCDHAVWLTAANVLALGTVSLLPIVSATVEDAVMRWLRAAELSCDRAALLVVQDPKVVVSSFMKLAGGSGRFAGELSVDAFLQQAKSYEQASSSPLGWYLRNAQNRALSHPLPVLRAAEIDTWSRTAEYKLMGKR